MSAEEPKELKEDLEVRFWIEGRTAQILLQSVEKSSTLDGCFRNSRTILCKNST